MPENKSLLIRYYLLILSLVSLNSCARSQRDSSIRSVTYSLGSTELQVSTMSRLPKNRFFFIRLHDNELTARDAALTVLNESGGTVLSIENGQQRNVVFTLHGRSFKFDPNRIFTGAGINFTLEAFRNNSEAARDELQRFADFILNLIPDSAIVIAVHNNSDREYSIREYTGALKADAAAVHINPSFDPDDFIYTSDSNIYRGLRDQNMNVVLQDNEKVKDDGSLSVLLGRAGRTYVNVEAESGHLEQQQAMLRAVIGILANKPKRN